MRASDIFKIAQKYSSDELSGILKDANKPILVCVGENDTIIGYCFCVFQKNIDYSVLTDIKTLYIDDLCVDEKSKGKHIGKELYLAALDIAKENNCYNITLNV